ncbi:EmrB/QacA subfamily drug resistance transporter [Jatrophihabitans sp. GAS493]|uniref:DHA2 family efflux MFS transporter permease subunit n=1 Tax=Jatrophihabitans sp. GAS493 TaxID=1907575 RepID=UPI000BB93328|nr:DHA2 family efflux MFS transporter permease subunit [Jatrophihabitans sp. GAS493]SOD70860.1 EmrB/QacA subfamily drug resistance transporter [Jatrophihabitans sp. GAS493]
MVNSSQPQPSGTAPGSTPATSRPGLVLAILSVAAFMASLDLFIVNVAFDDIGHDFSSASLSDLSWILNGYAITYAALLVPLGRLADRYGRKAGFLLGVGLFTVASAACAASTGLWLLVFFRVLQAVGAALLTPTSLGLLLSATPAQRRARAVRIWAASGALAAAAGPVVGGLLVSASWRWVFLVNIPIGIVALIATVRYVPDSRDANRGPIPDLAGALLLVIAIGSLALGLVKAPSWGWLSADFITTMVVAALGLALFWYRSLHHRAPVVEPALLKVRAFAWSNVTALLFSIGFAASLLSNILWMQQIWHYSALRTGLAVAPGPLMVPIFAAVGQRLASRVSVGRLAAAGCLLFGVGAVLVLTRVGPTPNYAEEILPGWLVGGIGVGLALPTILSAATIDLPAARAATGSAVVNMSRQVGTVLGVSILVALLGVPHGYLEAHTAFQRVWWAIAISAWVAAVTAFGMTPRGQRVDVETSAPLESEPQHGTSASGVRSAMLR